jgi:hypothetical protein
MLEEDMFLVQYLKKIHLLVYFKFIDRPLNGTARPLLPPSRPTKRKTPDDDIEDIYTIPTVPITPPTTNSVSFPVPLPDNYSVNLNTQHAKSINTMLSECTTKAISSMEDLIKQYTATNYELNEIYLAIKKIDWNDLIVKVSDFKACLDEICKHKNKKQKVVTDDEKK